MSQRSLSLRTPSERARQSWQPLGTLLPNTPASGRGGAVFYGRCRCAHLMPGAVSRLHVCVSWPACSRRTRSLVLLLSCVCCGRALIAVVALAWWRCAWVLAPCGPTNAACKGPPSLPAVPYACVTLPGLCLEAWLAAASQQHRRLPG